MAKSAKYSSKEDVDELEGLSERLAIDLRRNIRALGSHPIYSDAWCEMATTCGRIAKISDMESSVAASKSDATLWETEEQALRYLLEDGKLNLCLRNMVAFKTHQRSQILSGEAISAEHRASGDDFEKGLGVVLRNAWDHLEVLQTTDIPALLEHACEVINFCVTYPKQIEHLLEDIHQRQEILVFYYLCGLIKATTHIDESRVLPYMREQEMFMMAIKLTVMFYDFNVVALSHIFKCCEMLSLIADTEDYSTYQKEYVNVSNSEDVGHVLKLQALCNKEFQTESAHRSALRPLMDAMSRIKRQASRK